LEFRSEILSKQCIILCANNNRRTIILQRFEGISTTVIQFSDFNLLRNFFGIKYSMHNQIVIELEDATLVK